ncbi:FxsA family protein [Megalodesulfovibrio gigas]|uniref:Putative FxsA cytoplasmic membrane protein n=1 Tax=Megalodesulfovibrio gigas (strain ATCC 19364 / DSM 1382 / NCIMB 9332 / VKM B-1759) TaxID=1121448 RepID=T2GCS1_MEGG1|nr:FxsA family protein [Megalodesulfovibrio gigas]AGW13702.1 putative FxsA cytoplasmic membrane protein [Megalodesulfovibrio gigas DSM 1382 = ATCC 19364]
MMLRLFLAFTLIPVLELYLLVKVGTQIGVFTTVAIVFLSGFAGAWLARREGMNVVLRIREQLARGVMPASELMDGACVLVAAVLLVTPGFITDALGLALLVPAARTLLKVQLVRWFERAVQRGQVHVMHGGMHRGQQGRPKEPPPYDIDV